MHFWLFCSLRELKLSRNTFIEENGKAAKSPFISKNDVFQNFKVKSEEINHSQNLNKRDAKTPSVSPRGIN